MVERMMLNLLNLLPMLMLNLPLLLRRSTKIPLKKRQDLDKQKVIPCISIQYGVVLIVGNIGLNLDRE